MRFSVGSSVVLPMFLLPACATIGVAPSDEMTARDSVEIRRELAGMRNGAWESTYAPLPSHPTVIRGATVMTAAGEEIAGGEVVMADGTIVAVGRGLEAPAGATVIDATGKFVTPGIIDTHSHLGVYPSPGVSAHSEGNEATDPTTPEVWAVHSVWPQDPGFIRALAGGVTTLQVLPGSANLIGGRGVTLHPIPGRSAQEMMVPGAPMALKMACGENPKRVYQDRGPSTRMGNWAGYREAFIEAERYRKKWDDWVEDGGEKPDRDLANETLAEVLRGNILVHNHCYRADMVPQNIALVSDAGAHAILHTDDAMGIQIMNQDAAQAMYAGIEAGLDVSRDEALRWITANPAWALGIDERTGTLEAGKNADVVLWSADPFSVYAVADQVWIDGALVYDRNERSLQPLTDFEIGILPPATLEALRGGAR